MDADDDSDVSLVPVQERVSLVDGFTVGDGRKLRAVGGAGHLGAVAVADLDAVPIGCTSAGLTGCSIWWCDDERPSSLRRCWS